MFAPRPRMLRITAVPAIAALLLLAACASTEVVSEWSDPQLAGRSLRGATVLVVCDAYDLDVKRICQEQLASEVTARGAAPVTSADTRAGGGDDRHLEAARAANAAAVLALSVSIADTRASPAFSIGVGGFGIGGGSVRGGVGVSVPVGGGRIETGYAATSRLTDATEGRLLWTAKATTPASSDVQAQMAELAKALVGAAQRAGLF